MGANALVLLTALLASLHGQVGGMFMKHVHEASFS